MAAADDSAADDPAADKVAAVFSVLCSSLLIVFAGNGRRRQVHGMPFAEAVPARRVDLHRAQIPGRYVCLASNHCQLKSCCAAPAAACPVLCRH